MQTSGGKGRHVVAPLTGRTPWATVQSFARSLAESLLRGAPGLYRMKALKAELEDKIFLDFFRNHRGGTLVAPYSTRAKPRAPVSTPLSWDELATVPHPAHFIVANLPNRIRSLPRDPWSGFFSTQ